MFGCKVGLLMTFPALPATAALDARGLAVPKSAINAHQGYPLFDWLRIILASLVTLGHQGMPVLGPIDANLPVIVFLALSGWLIGGILFRTSVAELPRFFFNRATRIWIPYLFAVVLFYGLAAWREGIDANWLKYLFYDLTFTHTIFTEFPRALQELPLGGTGNHFWSISVEELFYLAAPLLILFMPAGRKLWAWVVIVVVLLALHPTFAAIALGVLAALTARQYPDWYLEPAARVALWAACAAAFVLCWLYNTEAQRAVFAVLLVQILAIPAKRGTLGMFLGAVSYPLYLNHWMGAFLVNGVLKQFPPVPPALAILASFAVAMAAGVVTWALVDRHVMRERDAWYQPRRGIALWVAAYGLLAIGLTGGTIIRSQGG